MQEEKKYVIGAVIVAVIVVAIGIFSCLNKSGDNTRQGFYEGELSLEKMSQISLCPLTSDKNAFAKCLTDKGWVMYGAAWCSHCKTQKELFGSSFQYIKYVECPDNTQLCLDKGVNGFPTWIIEK